MHLLPAAFVVGNLLLLLLAVFDSWLWLLPIALYVVMVFVDSLQKNKSLKVALLSVPAAYIQLFGYGTGFLVAFGKENFVRKSLLHREKP